MGFKQNISVTLDIGANISQVRAAANEMQGILGKINLDKGVSSNLTNMFSQLNSALGELEAKSGKSLHSLSDTKGIESSISKVQSIIATINGELGRLGSGGTAGWQKITAGLVGQMQTAAQAIKQYKDVIAGTEKEEQNLERTHKKAMDASTAATAKATEMQGKYAKAIAAADAAEKKLAQDVAKRDKKQEDYDNAQKDVKDKKVEIEKFKKTNNLHFTKDGDLDKRYKVSSDVLSQYEKLTSQLSSLESAAQRAGESLEKANNTVTKSTGQHQAAAASVDAVKIKLDAAKGDAEKAAQALQVSSDAVKNFNASAKDTAAFDQLKDTLSKTFGDETFKSVNNLEELEAKMQQFAATASGEVKNGIEQMINTLQKSAPAMKEAGEKAHETGNNIREMTSKGKDLEMLSSRFKYFFGIMGGFQLFKRAIRGGIQTIKELDAAMTQTAVVSTKTIGQMWKTLPEYSKKAKELAASMKDVYSAQTLYVQQGLGMDQALNLGVETLKMARVAGIDASTATDSMTAALRGFKMELNEVSATRINDVYSKLAQNTASNVKEISTAMTKVASLASNANMSFENTAAYLSKIIETTREGAETAGTALKTVIARFSEVKKLYSEGELTGTTEEGEEVDVNKIAKALREVGINMNEYFTGAVGLDTIFGKLGEKWNSLTTIQQRYIATMAAGSRQQSRFIALMQDWGRTTELMNMAYDSKGSGQEQFEKTLDSLDAKITKLKTEWQQFIMGIANNSIVGWIVNAGTKILEILNNIIDKLSGGSGLAKAILSVITAFSVFKVSGALVRGVLGRFGTAIGTKAAEEAGKGFIKTFTAQVSSASAGTKLATAGSLLGGKLSSILGLEAGKTLNLAGLRGSLFTGRAITTGETTAFNALIQSANQFGISSEQAQLALKNLEAEWIKAGGAPKQFSAALKANGMAMQATAKTAGALGTALMVVGGIIILVASRLQASDKVAKNVGDSIKWLGIAILAFGAILKITQVIVKNFGIEVKKAWLGLPKVGWIIAITAAVIALGVALAHLLRGETAEEKFKRISEAADKLKDSIDEVKNKFKEAQDLIEKINEQENVFDELVVGTEEWNTAVQKLNQSIYELLKIYPELAGAIEWVNEGYLKLNTESEIYQNWLKNQQKNSQNSNIAASSSGVATKKAEYKKKYFDISQVDPVALSLIASFLEKPEGSFSEMFSKAVKETGFWEFADNLIKNGTILGKEDLINTFKSYYKNLDFNTIKNLNYELNDFIKGFEELPDSFFSTIYDKAEINRTIAAENLSGINSAFEKSKYFNNDYSDAYRQNVINNFYKMYNEISDEEVKAFTKSVKNKREYMRAAGLKNENDITKELFEEYARNQITIERIFTNQDKYTTDLTNFLNKFEPSQQKIIAKIISNDTKNLTIKEIEQLKELQNNKDFDQINKFTPINASSIISNYDKLFSGTDKDKDEIIRIIDQAGEVTLNEIKNIVAGYNRAKTNNNEENFLNSISQIYKIIGEKLNGEILEKAKNIISSIDWSDTNSINKAIQDINELIEATDEFGDTIKYDTIKSLKDATDAISKFNEKSLKEKTEQLEGAREAGDKIKEGKSVTAKEYEYLKDTIKQAYENAGQNWNKDWVQIGLDEWVYIGTETNTLLDSINTSVNQILQNSIDKKAKQVEKGKKIGETLLNPNFFNEQNNTNQFKNLFNSNTAKNEHIDWLKFFNFRPIVNEQNNTDSSNFSGGTGYSPMNGKMGNGLGYMGSLNIGKKQFSNIVAKEAFNFVTGFMTKNVVTEEPEIDSVEKKTSPEEPKIDLSKFFDEFLINIVSKKASNIFSGTIDYFKKFTAQTPAEDAKVDLFNIFNKTLNTDYFKNLVTNMTAEDAKAEEFKFNDLVLLANVLGKDGFKYEEGKYNENNKQELFDDLLQFLEPYINYDTNKAELGKQQYLASVLTAQNSSEQSLLWQTTNENATIAQSASDVLQGRVSSEHLLYTVEAMQEDAKIDETKIKETTDLFNALALATKKTATNIDNLNKALSDNWKTIKTADKTTAAYKNAMEELLPVFKKVFGEDVNSKWIEEHKEKIDALVKGGKDAEKAFKDIQEEQAAIAFKNMVKAPGEIGEALEVVKEKWDAFNGSQLQVGGTFYTDDLLNGINLTEQGAKDLADYINSIAGMTAEVQPITDADGQITGYRLAISNTGAAGSGLPKKSGGGGGGDNKEFKNDFDKYYNMVEDINELTRLRNLLETDYQQLLESETASGKAIYDNLKKQVDLLKERRDITADLAEKRKQQILDTLNDEEYKDVKQYAWWNENDLTIEIDWDAINKIKNSETGDKVKELVQKLEDFQSKYDEQIEALEDIENTLEDIRKRGRDEYISLEERLRDALVAKIQEQIDELSATNEAIDTANSNLIDSIQKTLDQQRQERENAKTEEELANKEQRLAYLQQDSSGANAVEIAQLQKELDEARENYTDQLIDQKISELQEQNDEAAQQRQEQIDLMQQSLDWQEKNGEFWEQAYQLMNNGIGPDGTLVTGSELEQLLKQGEGWQALSQEGKMNWLSDLETMVAEAVGYLYLSRQLEKIGTKAGTEITFTDAEGNTHTGKVDKNGNVVIDNGDGTQTVWKDVYQSYDGSYRTLETEENAKTENKPATGTSTSSTPSMPSTSGPSNDNELDGHGWYSNEDEHYHKTKKGTIVDEHPHVWDLIGSPESLAGKTVTCNYCKRKKTYPINGGGGNGVNYHEKYATGGLNTKTGPAWLDGTKSHPELVLNARDTENFIQLKDHLATLRQMSTNGLLGAGGDNYYDIDVHVDSLGSDYDVDMAIDRIKARIYQDGAYRNVNTLNRLR